MKHSWKRIFATILAVAMTLSLLPATALAAPEDSGDPGTVIDVTDYGADPTGAKESSTAVRKALEYAKTLDADTPKTIVFPKGEYHFYEDYSETREWYVSNTLRWNESADQGYNQKHVGILVEGMENVTIDGNGSLFMFHGNMTTMAAVDSRNVTFQNFSEDFASPEVVDVMVESHEGDNAAILFIPACYNFTVNGTNINWQGEASPVTGRPYWSGDNGFLGNRQYVDTISGRHVSNGKDPFSGVSSIEPVDGTHIKVTYSNANSRPPVGQGCQMRHANPRKTAVTFFWQSEDVTVQNANFYFLHGFGMVSQLSKNITLDHVNCVPRPGTGRTSAGFADFVQMSSIGGDINIRDCNFAGPHDDPINVHGTFLKVVGVSSDRTKVKVKYIHNETWGFPQYYVGDKVDFTVQETLAHIENSEYTVKAVTNPGEGTDLDGTTARSKDNENDMRTIIVTLDKPLANNIGTGHVMENVTYIPNVTIENCRFSEVSTRGILVTSSKNVVLRNNYFDRIMSSSIFISNDAQEWYESGRTKNVLITGNTFVVQNTAGNQDHYGWNSGIMVWPTNRLDDANNQIHTNMRIEDNTFYILEGMADCKNIISAKSVKDLTIKNNRFLRYQPNVELSLSADSRSVAAGGSQATTLTSGGTTVTNRLYRFKACKNVTIEGNVYDDGLNKGIRMDETSITTAGEIHDRDGGLAYNTDNQLPAVGAVTYYSDHPEIATVDANGVVTGVSAGTANITAFRTVAGRTFESNTLTFEVNGTAVTPPDKIEIDGESTVDVGGTLTLAATATTESVPSTDGIAWSVTPVTEGAAATITTGVVLTGTAPGVVEVTASKGGVTASKLVTVNKPNSVYLSDLDWTSANTGDSWRSEPLKDQSWESGKDNNGVRPIKLTGPDNNEVTFAKGIGTHAASTITYDLTGLGYDRFTAKVGVSYYKHDSNEPHLYFVVEGDGTQKYASGEMLGSTAYKEVDVDIAGVNTLALKLTQPSNVWSAHGNWADAKLTSTNHAPNVGDVTVAADETNHTVTLRYAYNDTDRDEQTDSIIKWYVSATQNGHFVPVEGANTATLTVTAATAQKYVKAVVVPRDATGRYGAPETSSVVQAPAAAVIQNDATLSSLSVTGLTLTPAFDPNVTEYTVNVPATVETVTVNAAATQERATVAGTGNVALTGATTTATVTVTAPDGTTRQPYTITINRARSSDVTLKNLTATAGSAEISYVEGTRFYELTASEDAMQLSFGLTLPDGATAEARYNGEEKGDNTEWDTAFPLKPGLNNLELRVTAEDGISTALYRVRVLKSASSDAALTSLTVNEQELTLDVNNEAMERLDAGVNSVRIKSITSHYNATVHISVNGKPVENNTDVTLTQPVSTATVRVVAEDGVHENVYTVTLIKNDRTSAELYKLDLGKVALDQPFDPNVTEYTAVNYGNLSTTLNAAAAQEGAAITYEMVDDYVVTENAEVSNATFNFYKGAGLTEEDGKTYNTVKVTVTAPDKNPAHTKTYTIKVEVLEWVYLSDQEWASSTTGWGGHPTQKDKDIEGRGIALRGENGAKLEFDKGIGAHANSVTLYNLTGMGFSTLTGQAGISWYMCEGGPNRGNNTPNIKFQVILGEDDTADPAWTRTQNYDGVAPDEFRVDISQANHLILKADGIGGNGGAHANWADMKLWRNIPDIANQPEILIKYLELEEDGYTVYANTGNDDHTVELHPVVKPIGAALSGRQSVLRWTTEHSAIATAGQGELHQGIVTGQSVGTTTLKVYVDGKEEQLNDTCTITVKWELEGKVAVTGGPRIGSTLTGALNQLDEGAKGHVDIQWWRKGANDEDFAEINGANAKEYAVAIDKDNVDAQYKVVVTAQEESYYEGTSESDPITMTKLAGEPMKADPTAKNASTSTATDGAINGLFKGRVYQYQKVGELNETAGTPVESAWETFHDTEGDDETELPGNYGTAVIANLPTGHYVVRRAADDLHEAGPHRTVTVDVVGSQKFHVTNPNDFDGNIVQVGRTDIAEGDTMTLTVTPKNGYELVPDSLKAIENDTGIAHVATPKAGTTNQYTITMPNAAVTISAEFQLKTYTIRHTDTLKNITCDQGDNDHSFTIEDMPITIILTPDEGYEMPRQVTITDASGAEFSAYTYRTDETDPAKRVLIITAESLPGDLTISGEAVRKTYPVDYTGLTNGLRAPNAPQTATHGQEFAVTLTAAQGYALPDEDEITVTIGGTAYEGFTYTDGTVTIPAEAVTGSIAIEAAGVAQDLPLQTVTMVGPARVGRTLTVNTVPVNARVTYQWCYYVEGEEPTPIENATDARYVIPATDEGKSICVTVTAVPGSGYAGELTTEPTAAILGEAEAFVFVESVTVDETASVEVGKTVRLTATVTPENPTSGVLFWSSNNEAVATVDQNGVVTGVAEGTATIQVESTDQLDRKVDFCEVTVTQAETPVTPSRPSGGNNASTETTKTETRDDGTKVTTVTKSDGSKTQTVEQPDGTKTEAVTTKDGDVTITVTDASGEELVKAEIPATIPESDIKFDDIDATPWAVESINKVAGLELVKGTGGSKYSPVVPMTRGALATVLHRLSQGKTDYENTFKDVAQGKYYTEGVTWAAKAKVVTGYSADIFAPDDVITREQLAVMLARYAKLIGMNTKADPKAVESFADGDSTGAWAVDGVAWCVEQGILKGKGQNNLDPTAKVTRAEVAVMLDRFISLLK